MLDTLYRRFVNNENDFKIGYYAKQALERLQNTITAGERELGPSVAEVTGSFHSSTLLLTFTIYNWCSVFH